MKQQMFLASLPSTDTLDSLNTKAQLIGEPTTSKMVIPYLKLKQAGQPIFATHDMDKQLCFMILISIREQWSMESEYYPFMDRSTCIKMVRTDRSIENYHVRCDRFDDGSLLTDIEIFIRLTGEN